MDKTFYIDNRTLIIHEAGDIFYRDIIDTLEQHYYLNDNVNYTNISGFLNSLSQDEKQYLLDCLENNIFPYRIKDKIFSLSNYNVELICKLFKIEKMDVDCLFSLFSIINSATILDSKGKTRYNFYDIITNKEKRKKYFFNLSGMNDDLILEDGRSFKTIMDQKFKHQTKIDFKKEKNILLMKNAFDEYILYSDSLEPREVVFK